jgi:hypothetical protein
MGYERKHKSVSEIVAESNAKRRARRANATPPPWILLKLAVFITLGIIVYATYVYIGRLCVPMLKRNNGALGSRSLASACAVGRDAVAMTEVPSSCLPGRLLRPGCDDALGILEGLLLFWITHLVLTRAQVCTISPGKARDVRPPLNFVLRLLVSDYIHSLACAKERSSRGHD